MQNGLVPHSRVWIKIWEGYHSSKEFQPMVPMTGSSVPMSSGCKNQWGLSWWKKLLESQAVPLKEPTNELT